jgi:hypothetical protein
VITSTDITISISPQNPTTNSPVVISGTSSSSEHYLNIVLVGPNYSPSLGSDTLEHIALRSGPNLVPVTDQKWSDGPINFSKAGSYSLFALDQFTNSVVADYVFTIASSSTP